MSKRKILKKHGFSLVNIPRINMRKVGLEEIEIEEPFKNQKHVAEALFQCLVENDTDAFIEILDAYLRINRSHAAKQANMSRSTVKLALSKKGNPTLKTIANIVHATTRRS
jgi:DNA-binding phage protein